MPAISKAKHSKLTFDLKEFLSTVSIASDDKKILEANLIQLEIFFETYTITLCNLHQLIVKYNAAEHLVKIQGRQMQLKHLKQKMPS